MTTTKLKLLLALPIVALALGFLAMPHAAKAATYTVTNTDDAGAGSFRQAITDANGSVGADQIDFNIAGAGPHTITLTTGGITITDQVKVNGLSQSGSVCNGTSSTLKVVIEGNGIGVGGVSAANTEINGLVIGVNSAVSIGSDNNIVRCNFFGTTADGTTGVATTGTWGLVLWNSNTTVGGNNASDMNLFGNSSFWVPGSQNQIIKNNQIGTDITGMNGLAGILAFAYSTNYQNITITDNLISKIHMWYSTYDNLTISRNKIGTNITGTAAIHPNIGTLLSVVSTVSNSTIGGPNESDGNLISGGVAVDTNEWGRGLQLGAGPNLLIQNNKFGVNADASAVIGNGNDNLLVSCANSCTNLRVLDNVLSGSSGLGLQITNSGDSDQNTVIVKRNYIGTNKNLTLDGGNASYGMLIGGSLKNTIIGGSDPADANYIWHNSNAGIYIEPIGPNSIIGNSIYDNNSLGIKLGSWWSNNPTANDPGDGDSGPNDLLNYPIITEATENSGNTDIGYSLDVPAGDYRIEFFSNTAADPTGYGEGETFIGYANVTSSGTGNQNFSTTITGTGHTHLAATATLKDAGSPSGFGPTSEFGKYEPQTDLSVASDDGTTSAVYGEPHQYTFTVTNNGPGDVDQFTFQGANNVLDPYTYNVDSDNSTATSPGSFSSNTWSGLLRSGETLIFKLNGNVANSGSLETSQVCIDPPIRLGGQTVIDTNSNNNCGTDDDTIVPLPTTDLSLTKTLDAPGTVKNGQQATYTFTVTNNGPMATVEMGYIYDVIPPGTSINSTISDGDLVGCEDNGPSSSLGSPAIPDGEFIACSSGAQLSSGESISFKMILDVISIDETQVITNYAAAINPFDTDSYNAILGAYMAGQNFFTIDDNSVAQAAYDPNAPVDDNDGIASEVESAAPNNGDANGDNTPDSQQDNVASFVNPVTGQYTTLEVGSECSITSASVDPESANTTPDPSYNYPAGLMNFSLSCGTPGITTTVNQYYYGVATQSFVARKYNPNTNTYTNIDSATITGVSIGNQSATKASYQVTDGTSLDTDGTQDGNITDPTGLAIADAGNPITNATSDLLAKTGINQHKSLYIFITTLLISSGILGIAGLTRQRVYYKKRRK